MISTLCWVKRGVAQPVPAFGDEIEAIEMQAAAESDAEDDDDPADDGNLHRKRKRGGMDVEDALSKKYSLDSYDDDADAPGLASINQEVDELIAHNKSCPDNEIQEAELQRIAEEELDDLMIRPTDAILLTGVTEEDEFSHLDVQIYEEEERNLYTHHDIMLPSFPLALEWMNYFPKQATSTTSSSSTVEKGNTVAIGTFQQHIEIWDLDVIDNLEPLKVLGQPPMLPQQSSGKKQGKNQRKKNRPARIDGHTDAIMSLSWNKTQRNLLASGSADHTIRLWDLDTGLTLAILRHHRNKVQALRWHPVEPSLLASAGYDRRVCVVDVRSPAEVRVFTLPEDPEAMLWHPHSPAHLLVSTEAGRILCFDATKPEDRPIMVLEAHSKPVSGMDLNPSVPGLLVTVSTDRTFKFWDLSQAQPTLLYSEEVPEQLFSVAWNPDSPFLLAIGGKGTLKTISALKYDTVFQKYHSTVAGATSTSQSTTN